MLIKLNFLDLNNLLMWINFLQKIQNKIYLSIYFFTGKFLLLINNLYFILFIQYKMVGNL